MVMQGNPGRAFWFSIRFAKDAKGRLRFACTLRIDTQRQAQMLAHDTRTADVRTAECRLLNGRQLARTM
jgi:hypothetical protein